MISRRFSFLDEFVSTGVVRLVFSDELIQEFLAVTKRDKLRKYFTEEIVTGLVDFFHDYGEIVQITTSVKVCRDPKDDLLLNLAIDSAADYLVTGDDDLLILNLIQKTQIVTLKQLMIILKS